MIYDVSRVIYFWHQLRIALTGVRSKVGESLAKCLTLHVLMKLINFLRGVVVEWLEQLDYDTESRRKVVSSRLGCAMRRLENSLCQLSSKWVPFSN